MRLLENLDVGNIHNRQDKVSRLEEALPEYRNYEIMVFTDSYSDLPLIDISSKVFGKGRKVWYT